MINYKSFTLSPGHSVIGSNEALEDKINWNLFPVPGSLAIGIYN